MYVCSGWSLHHSVLQGQTVDSQESFGEVLNHLNRDTKDGGIPPFVKCHRSTAVNLSKVSRIGRQSCVLTGEIEVPVSRGMYQQLNQAFIQENL